ncbi:MAG: hypothetical protein R2850_12945, partial [Bacteroidia bacterium]
SCLILRFSKNESILTFTCGSVRITNFYASASLLLLRFNKNGSILTFTCGSVRITNFYASALASART